jgi:hypothetical protein
MTDKPSTTDLVAIHAQALKRADEAFDFERENIRRGREDQRFAGGEQWTEEDKTLRGPGRPMLTIPRLGTFVRQVTGDLRQNTPAIKVMPARGKASQDKADVLSGIIRSIESESDAGACYVKAATNAAEAGQGAFRVLTKYIDDKSFDQYICIEQIADPFGVLMDPFALKPDKSDMTYAFVFERYSKESFKTKWPDATPVDVDVQGDGKTARFEWMVGESVRVAEYWCRETTKSKLYQTAEGKVTNKKPTPRQGEAAARERDVEIVSIVSYMISGKETLSGPHAWAGKYIPICFVPGLETTIDGATQRKGMIRDAKDAQRLINYARTTEAESTALQPKAPFVATVDQIKGYEDIWNTAGTKNHSWLPYNFNPAMGANQAPQRSQPPVMSTGLQSLSLQAGMDLHDVIGIYPPSLGAKSNETSGVAIRARQNEGDTGSNYIPDNTRRAISYCGRILCDLIPKVYDAERIVRLLKESGDHEMAKINAADPENDPDAETMTVVDSLDDGGEYDVVISTGPNYQTRQQEMAENIIEAGRVFPQIGQVAADLFVKALNFPGGEEIAKRLEKMLPPGITEDGPMPQPPPDPEKEADARESMASANLKDAQAAKTLLEADALALQMGEMGAQLQQLTQAVMALARPGDAPPQGEPPMMAPPDMPPQAPPMADSEPPLEPMADPNAPQLEPMTEGAPV